MAQEIKFGTDGWRGIIADDFTFDNVRRVAAAIASYVLKYEEAQHGVIVGYDTRFASAGPPVVLPRSPVRAVYPFTVSRKSGMTLSLVL